MGNSAFKKHVPEILQNTAFRGFWSPRMIGFWKSADCKRGRRKGATSKTSKIVKKCQKYFRHFSTFFAQGKKRQKSSKSVKKFFDTFRQFSRRAPFFRPLLQFAEKSGIPEIRRNSTYTAALMRFGCIIPCPSTPLAQPIGRINLISLGSLIWYAVGCRSGCLVNSPFGISPALGLFKKFLVSPSPSWYNCRLGLL